MPFSLDLLAVFPKPRMPGLPGREPTDRKDGEVGSMVVELLERAKNLIRLGLPWYMSSLHSQVEIPHNFNRQGACIHQDDLGG